MIKPVSEPFLPAASTKRLLQYSLGVSAAVSGTALTGQAQVTDPNIRYTNTNGITGSSFYFDLNSTGGAPTVSTTAFAAADFRLYESGFDAGTKPRVNAYPTNAPNSAILSSARGNTNRSYALALSTGVTIGSAAGTFTSNTYLDQTATRYFTGQGLGDWKPGTVAYLGLSLTNTTAATTNYGWAYLRFNGTSNPAGEFTVYGLAYQTVAGQSIQAVGGQVPEPSTALLLAAGAGGVTALRALRRRRQEEADAAAGQ